MNFEEYVVVLKRANPAIFNASKIKLTVTSFEAQLRLAFEAGMVEGRIEERGLPREAESLFKQFFG